MGEELEPCPFCGGKVELRHDHTTENIDTIHHKQNSNNCPLDAGVSAFLIGNSELLTAWNTRQAEAERDEAMAEVERLRKSNLALTTQLAFYAAQLCEGWCQGKDPKACAAIGADNCAGCPAVVTISRHTLTTKDTTDD